ncbi:MAG TPA: TIGR01777 family oxidoreductase [candidate division Zixibacteria bacterium]|nr:TIGR01777 family oxidoreductase [candidate division Zixibacteria bacterium]
MHVVIAGGTGLFGRALQKSLAGDGHEIVVLSRDPDSASEKSFTGVKIARWSTSELDSWRGLIDGTDVVINLAGENLAGTRFLPGRWTNDKKQKLRSSRVDAGRAIARNIAAAEVKPRLLIQASAVGYYGPRGDEEVTESVPAGDDFLAKLCVDWEEATEDVERFGVRRIILRSGIVLSAEGGPLPRLIKQYRLFAGGSFGGGDQYWPWIHIDDVIGAIRHLMEDHDAAGPVNVTSPTPLTNRHFSKELGRVLGRPSFWPIPTFALKLLVGEVSVVVLEGQRAVPEKLAALGYEFKYSELGPALSEILSR